MRICVVTERAYPFTGGTETRWFELCRRLAKKHDVHMYTARGDTTNPHVVWDHLPREELADGFRIHRLGKVKPYPLRSGTRSGLTCLEFGAHVAYALTRSEPFDIYDFNCFPLVHLLTARLAARGRCVLTWHEVWGVHWRQHGGMGKFGHQAEFLASRLRWDKHIAVSEFTAQRLADVCGIDPRSIVLVPNGIGPEVSPGSQKVPGKILFVGRMTPDKHIHDLLFPAFRIAKSVDPSLTLHIIGSGPYLPFVKSQAARMECIRFHGSLSRSQVVEHMKSSVLVCLPSEREGQSIVALEAMGCATPVVTVSYPLNAVSKCLVMNGLNGLVAEPSPVKLAQGILAALSQWDLLSRNCVRTARRYSWDRSATLLEETYSDLLRSN